MAALRASRCAQEKLYLFLNEEETLQKAGRKKGYCGKSCARDAAKLFGPTVTSIFALIVKND